MNGWATSQQRHPQLEDDGEWDGENIKAVQFTVMAVLAHASGDDFAPKFGRLLSCELHSPMPSREALYCGSTDSKPKGYTGGGDGGGGGDDGGDGGDGGNGSIGGGDGAMPWQTNVFFLLHRLSFQFPFGRT